MNHISWKSLGVYLAISIFSLTVAVGQVWNDPVLSTDSTMSLVQCLDAAVANYPSIKAKMAETSAANEELKRSKASRNPKLMFQEQIMYASANTLPGTFWPNAGYALPSAGSVRDKQIWKGAWEQYTTLMLEGPITTFGKIKYDIAVSQQAKSTADYDYLNEVFQHKIKVADTYLKLLTLRKITNVQRTNLKRAQDIKAVIDSKVNGGLRPGVDSSFVSAELSKAKLTLLEAIRQEKVTELYLGELTGLSGVSVVPKAEEPIKTLPASPNIEIDYLKNPSILYAKSKWMENVQREEKAKRAWMPTINYMVAGIGRGSGVTDPTTELNYTEKFMSGIRYRRYNYLAGVYIRWNVFEFTKSTHERKIAHSLASSSKYNLDEVELITTRALDDAKLQLSLSIQKAQEAPIQLRSAKGAYGQAFARYDSGLATLPELSDNLVLLNRAEADMAIVYFNVWRSVLKESAASGDFDFFLSQLSL